ncbi:MAG: response regulator [Proteobacteria bacterium]|nr:response regulator [Pseudomonadota bacterium]MBU1738505.1 response regulator [Pseudomonadota bacterium]
MNYQPEDKSILLVDDDPSVLEIIGRSLRALNYTNLLSVSNGDDAIKLINLENFDLIITDLIMDNVDGFDVLKKAKAKDPFMGVVIITGHGGLVHSAVEALRLGADDYLLKPWETEEMVIRIQNVLEKLDALRKIKLYEEFLPICCSCHMIRDDDGVANGTGSWLRVDEFLTKKTTAKLTHAYCPKCAEKMRKESGII